MQTLALLRDTLRLLLARRMFWITLIVSALLVVAYASIGFDSKGVSILFGAFHFEDPRFAAGTPLSKVLILGIFSNFMVPIWLAWGASILALVSTTSVFPDFMSEGAIDLVLAKPISRLKIFIVRYVGCLIFVLMQVGIFCVGVFLVVGARVGEWEWLLFAAIPVVVAYFSYLFAFNVLVAVVTRSAIAALLFTLLFWFGLFIAQTTEKQLNTLRTQQAIEVERTSRTIQSMERRLERIQTPGSLREALGNALTDKDQLQKDIDRQKQERESSVKSRDALARWHERSRTLMGVLPKNQETIGLLDRWLTRDANQTMADIFLNAALGDEELASIDESNEPERAAGGDPDRPQRFDRSAQIQTAKRVKQDMDTRSALYVMGTSLGFEAVLLGVACLIFIRRDF